METNKKPVVLCILDGYGITNHTQNNAVLEANTPHIKKLFTSYPWTTLLADGENVGMEEGNVGNSEVGHMNLGAAKLIRQLSLDITQSALTEYDDVQSFDTQYLDPKKLVSTSEVHLIGLISTGRVHSDLRHIKAMLKVVMNLGNTPILHIITDGRDSDPFTSYSVIEGLLGEFPKLVIGSISGRFYAMDRDNNSERTTEYLTCLTDARYSKEASDLKGIIESLYEKGQNDETIKPTSFGKLLHKDQDILLMNYRTDRFKQLTKALIDWKAQKGKGKIIALNDYGVTDHPAAIDPDQSQSDYYSIFSATPPTSWISKFLQTRGKNQLHIAETEKYNHVTYFFNGGQDIEQSNEDWQIIPSNKVSSHAEKPAMKAKEVTDYIIEHAHEYDYILVNYANPDMVAHTGDFKITVTSLEILDLQIKRLSDHILSLGGHLIITADHGNAECVGQVEDDHGDNYLDTSHNSNPVPLLLVSDTFNQQKTIEQLQETKNMLQNHGEVSFIDTLEPGELDQPNAKTPQYQLWYAGWLWISLR